MSLLSRLADQLEAAPDRVLQLTRAIAEDQAPALAEANRRQLFDGEYANGAEIVPPYAPMTVRFKILAGQPAGRVTLKDTGEFWASIAAHVDDETITLVATDPKTTELLDKYGAEVLGLGAPAVSAFRTDHLLPSLRDGLRLHFGR